MVLAQGVELHVAYQHHAVALGLEHAVPDNALHVAFIAAGKVAHRFRVALGCIEQPLAADVLAEVCEHGRDVRRDRVFAMVGNQMQFLARRVHRLAPMRCITLATMRSQRSPAKAKTPSQARSIFEASASRSRRRARKKRLRTVASGICSTAAVSSSDISSTAPSMNTVR